MKRRHTVGSQVTWLAALALGLGGMTTPSAIASTFTQTEVNDQNKFLVLAAPIGQTGNFKLLIIEQLNNRQQCWQENGAYPTTIDPLLNNFDFTGICGRSTDSNGYSVRMAGEDLAGRYHLRLARKGNDLVLIAYSLLDRTVESIEIGKTYGLADGFMKVYLNPGWRLTRRTYNGQPLGHIYLTSDISLTEFANRPPVVEPTPQPSLQSPTVPTGSPESPAIAPPQPQPQSDVPTVREVPASYTEPLPSTQPPTNGVVVPSVVVPTTPLRPTVPPAPSPQSRSKSYVVPVANLRPTRPTASTTPTTAPTLTNLLKPNNSLATSYRVLVSASTLAQQNRVRQLVPNAFRTTDNGQPAMQVGVFRDRATATALQQRLATQQLQATITPITVNLPTLATKPLPTPTNPLPNLGTPQLNPPLSRDQFNLPEPPSVMLARETSLWATYYYTHVASVAPEGVPLLDLAGNPLGPVLSYRDWCHAALQGSVQVSDGEQGLGTFNFAGRGSTDQVDCSLFYPNLKPISNTNRVRFKPSRTPYGEGAGRFALVPFRSIAVDRTYIPMGSVLYIPAARGTILNLPSGEQAIHDGYFYAADGGSAIKDNHIDVFLGARTSNPFEFVKSRANGTFEAYLVQDPQIKARLAAEHQLNTTTAFNPVKP